jgi:hypothetical protein
MLIDGLFDWLSGFLFAVQDAADAIKASCCWSSNGAEQGKVRFESFELIITVCPASRAWYLIFCKFVASLICLPVEAFFAFALPSRFGRELANNCAVRFVFISSNQLL